MNIIHSLIHAVVNNEISAAECLYDLVVEQGKLVKLTYSKTYYYEIVLAETICNFTNIRAWMFEHSDQQQLVLAGKLLPLYGNHKVINITHRNINRNKNIY